jgi:DNA-binding NtrC family response regulator
MLANYFLNRHATRLNKPLNGMSTKALGVLMRHDWPGNIRELENVVLSMAIMATGNRVTEEALPAELIEDDGAQSHSLDFVSPQSLEEIEAYFIRKTLREQNGDRTLAAEILGIDKSTLWRKMKRYKIQE